MYYIIYAEDAPDTWDKRKAARPEHLARMKPLVEQGRVLVAGPCPNEDTETISDAGVSGSVLIIDFDNLEDAQKWADADPYVAAGVYQSVVVKPFIKVLP
ncbi:YciI family protein [Alteromonas sediminis]|uniref:YciI family protein n=1 Tax=Alteromonas sediminis TaxID=2259342 RepID=A0A3N5Y845_9ALTE|nr:YciI family protein [Alteromonas sediminis]RPJ67109.1 YciI family protein [Alteromonas sediminis]